MARPAPRSWAGGPVAPLASAGGPGLFLPQGFCPTEALMDVKGEKGAGGRNAADGGGKERNVRPPDLEDPQAAGEGDAERNQPNE